ncbi:hypothetical protein KIN20_008341 [Parelaphostrongylus tenuis]|uniref:Uncharacterized protein n=1 Tax=Parelaphostrongylus tenuis TaxID=148309 RepID=A0AAD5MQC7_PARTN|nr:hypothetical protein KIN20_008341 [Parelaphostrongylus tenuis]
MLEPPHQKVDSTHFGEMEVNFGITSPYSPNTVPSDYPLFRALKHPYREKEPKTTTSSK